jgi:3-oxoacyl-[acyl-carrier-protein] synthase-1
MKPVKITAASVVSALGIGMAETAAGLRANRSGCRPCDYEDARLSTHIGRVDGVEGHALAPDLAAFECRNNRLADMALGADGFDVAVAGAVGRYGARRIATILGTSTSGIGEGEYAFARRDPATGKLPADFRFSGTQAYHALTRFVQARLGLDGPGITVSTACSSSAKVFADAQQLMDAGVCDAAVVGGADSLCLLTLYGFNSLQLLSETACRPNDVNRSGISIGEGAGFALLERNSEGTALAFLAGYGESADAHHMSAPHPEGLGAERAMREALARAGLAPGQIDYLNQHGTGTRQNDQSEDAAVARVFGSGMRCSSTKGATGHTLGAAGIVGAAICIAALREGIVPGNTNLVELDPAFLCRVEPETADAELRYALSNSFGFGGSNCSLIFGAAPC